MLARDDAAQRVQRLHVVPFCVHSPPCVFTTSLCDGPDSPSMLAWVKIARKNITPKRQRFTKTPDIKPETKVKDKRRRWEDRKVPRPRPSASMTSVERHGVRARQQHELLVRALQSAFSKRRWRMRPRRGALHRCSTEEAVQQDHTSTTAGCTVYSAQTMTEGNAPAQQISITMDSKPDPSRCRWDSLTVLIHSSSVNKDTGMKAFPGCKWRPRAR